MATKTRGNPPDPRVPGLKRHNSSFGFDIQEKTVTTSTPRTNRSKSTKKAAKDNSRTAARAEKISNSILREGFDQDAENKFSKMLEGYQGNVPNIPRSVVRIFISSTFSDMRAERNALVQEATPRLKEFCAAHDLDFQMADMRWGVTDDSQNDHSVEKICLLEVENCQKISLGPNFVLIKGTRYGFRPIPIEISTEDFDLLTAHTSNPDHLKLLHIWYLLDTNNIPPRYVLQPIRSQFTFFGDYSPGCDEPRAKDTENWHQTFQALQDILRLAANAATKAGKMSSDKLQEYLQSVTEREIDKGILDVSNPLTHTMVYDRSMSSLSEDALADKNANRYIDIIDTDGKLEIDPEVESLRQILNKKTLKKLKGRNFRQYTVPWIPGGIDPESNQEHDEYIGTFCIDFLTDMVNQIEAAMTDYLPKIRFSGWYTDYTELIHHLQFCNTKCETFCGQENVLDGIKSYILNDKSRTPFVLHAPSGAGKTSIMAMVMKNLPTWFKKKKHIGLIRFLGTSPFSTNIYDVLFSVICQLADNCSIIMDPISYKNMKNLVGYIPRLLRRVASLTKYPIVILLDSLDQLSSYHDAYSLSWLPTTLPSNIKLIVSTLPEEHGILANMKQIFPDDQCFLSVPPLSVYTGKEIVNKYLGKTNRSVSAQQLKLLMTTFNKNPGPLFLKLLLDEAVKWRSYTPEHELVLANSVRTAISQLFQNMETKFGEVITSHALGYITIALNGVSETEIEDVLSCDDEALNDVYRYHNPPVDGIVRIPPVVWARIRYDLKEYLVERRAHNKYTLNWYHRQFIETARARYAQGKAGQKLHCNFAEIFMYKTVRRSIHLEWRKITIEDADRQITSQAMVSKNKRMLACLPYYINNARECMPPDLAKENCFSNFYFLKTKVAAFPLNVLQEDLAAYVERTDDEEVQKLRNFFSLCKVEDVGNSEKLAVSLLAKISLSEGEETLKTLLNDARQYLESQTRTLLIPKYACLAPGMDTSNAMKDSLQGCEEVLAVSAESVLLRTSGEKMDEESQDLHAVYNTVTEEQTQIGLPCTFSDGLPPGLDHTGKSVLYVSEEEINTLNINKKVTTSKKFSDVCSEIPETSKPVMSALNTESSHLAILFDNCSLLLVELSSMKPASLKTLSEDATDVFNLVCTGSDSLAVIATGTSAETEDGTTTKGFIRVLFPGEEDNDRVRELSSVISHGLVGLGSSEGFLIGLSNADDYSTLIATELSGLDIVMEMSRSDPMIQMSVAKQQHVVVVLSQKGVVSLIDWRGGKVLCEFATDNPVACLCVNWSHRLAMLGDSQGQIVIYDTLTHNHCITFPAHANSVQKLEAVEDHVVSLGKNKELKVWSVLSLKRDTTQSNAQRNAAAHIGLLGQTEVASFDITLDSKELVTASRDGTVSIWSLDDMSQARHFPISIVGDKIQVVSKDNCVILDKTSRKMKIFNLQDGDDGVEADVPRGALDFTVSQDRSMLCIICQKEKGIMVEVMDLKVGKSKKTFYLKGALDYETIDIHLSANSRFILLRVKVTPKEYKEIEATWTKNGSFFPQPHPYKFIATDLTQATGGLMPCLRTLTKIPHLGEVMVPSQGNVVIFTTRRWVLFWDIPTGKCDQKVAKAEKKGMFYRPDWLGQSCNGTSLAIAQSNNQAYVAVGSEDGYLFVYIAESGLPVQRRVPTSKHTAAVMLTSFAPNNNWVASACRNNTIKIWETCSGKEMFSTRVNSEVVSMRFSADSQTLVLSIGSEVTRILVYNLHTG